MGRCFGWVMDGFSLGPLSDGDGDGEETTSGHVQEGRFRWTTHVVSSSLDALDRHVCVEVSTT